MRRLSGDFLQGPYNICKSQMHVILQKGSSQIIKVLFTRACIWFINFLLLLFCRISRCQYVLYATSPSPSREGRCPTLKWASTSTGTADRTPLRERERFPSALMSLALPSVCKQNNRASVFQIFTNKCSKGGCKQKEMMRVTCDQCHLNFCLKHRHPLDHDCKPDGKPLSKSGWVCSHVLQVRVKEKKTSDLIPFPPLRHAAVMRASASSSSASSSSSSGNPWPVSNGMSRAHSSRLELARSCASDVKRALQIQFSLLLSLSLSSAPQRLPTSVSAQNVVPPSASFQAGMVRTALLALRGARIGRLN